MRKKLAVCRLPAGEPIPDWALSGEFFSVTRTPDELSVVCPEDRVPPGSGLPVEGGWVALRLEGPFPFAMTGVLASFVQPLAEAEIPVFVISTFDTDYVLIKEEHRKGAFTVLGAAGHQEIE